MSIVESAVGRVKKAPIEASDRPEMVSHGRAPEPIGLDTSPRIRVSQSPLWQSRQPMIKFDVEQLRSARLYPPHAFAPKQRDDYRSLRREVIAASRAMNSSAGQSVGPIIVVTSALPGDGKSYTAINLALSIAGENVHDVLLIDGDTIKRTVSRGFGVENRPGLIELLSDPQANFLEYTAPTSNSKLHILPAGNRDESSADLLSAGRIEPLFDSIRRTMAGHFVVVDTPPILISSETPTFTDSAGQVLLVVYAGRTLQDSVKDAISRIRESVPVGVVLNGWVPTLPSDKKAYAAYYEYQKAAAGSSAK